MDRLNTIIDSVNAFAWGPPMLGILGVTGVLLTLGLVFMPWRKVGYGFRLLFDKGSAVGEGEVKPFNALMTALSATVGTGNIAGVATAIALGGPGAIFYMWAHRAVRHGDEVRRSRVRGHLSREGTPRASSSAGRCTTCATASASSPPNSGSGWGSRSRCSARLRRSASATRCRSTRWPQRSGRASECRPG